VLNELDKKGQVTVGNVVAVVIGLIMVLALAVPVVQDLIAGANLTGTTATIAALLPLLLVVGAVILVASLYMAN
jgi:hypothetical protein